MSALAQQATEGADEYSDAMGTVQTLRDLDARKAELVEKEARAEAAANRYYALNDWRRRQTDRAVSDRLTEAMRRFREQQARYNQLLAQIARGEGGAMPPHGEGAIPPP